MKEKEAYFHLKIQRHILFSAVFAAVLLAGLITTLTQIGQVQSIQQFAQTTGSTSVGSATGTQTTSGQVCNANTVLNPGEAAKLSGFCPEADPANPPQGFCKNFCADTANLMDQACKPGGLYHCTGPNYNGTCKASASDCSNGVNQNGFCGNGTVCCNKPPVPQPPPPALAVNAIPAAVRTPPGATGNNLNLLSLCQTSCQAPFSCSLTGICSQPIQIIPPAPIQTNNPAQATTPICMKPGAKLNDPCGPNMFCRYFGSGGINSTTLSCQAGQAPPSQVLTGNAILTGPQIIGALPNGTACRNGTECQSKNCAPNGTGWVCK